MTKTLAGAIIFFGCFVILERRCKEILRLFGKGVAEPKSTPAPIRTGKEGLPSAVVFVDYEHWYISLNNNYGIRPNIKAWFEDLQKRVNVKEVLFFADFSHKNLAEEIGRIRPFTNKIIAYYSLYVNTFKIIISLFLLFSTLLR